MSPTEVDFDIYDLLCGTPPKITLGNLDKWMQSVPPELLHQVAALGVVVGTGLDVAFGSDHPYVRQISSMTFGPIALELDSRGFEFPFERPNLDYWFLDWCARSVMDPPSNTQAMSNLRSIVELALAESFPDLKDEIRPFLGLITRVLNAQQSFALSMSKEAEFLIDRSSQVLPLVERFGIPDAQGLEEYGEPLSVFISYTGDDDRFHDDLIKHLSPLQRTNAVTIWSDRGLHGADNFDQAILERLRNADIVILLLSSSFINSDYCYNKEFPIALERHESGSSHLLPVIVRPFFRSGLPIAKLQLLPTRAKAVINWTNEDNAWVEVIKEIDSLVRRIRISPR